MNTALGPKRVPTRPSLFAGLAILVPAAAVIALGAVLWVERSQRARREIVDRCATLARDTEGYLWRALEQSKGYLNQVLERGEPLLGFMPEIRKFAIARPDPDAPFAVDQVDQFDQVDAADKGFPRTRELPSDPESGEDWTALLPELSRLEFQDANAAEIAARRMSQLALASGSPRSRATLRLATAGALQRAGKREAALLEYAAIASDHPGDQVEGIPLAFAARREIARLCLASGEEARTRSTVLALIEALEQQTVALPPGEVAAHILDFQTDSKSWGCAVHWDERSHVQWLQPAYLQRLARDEADLRQVRGSVREEWNSWQSSAPARFVSHRCTRDGLRGAILSIDTATLEKLLADGPTPPGGFHHSILEARPLANLDSEPHWVGSLRSIGLGEIWSLRVRAEPGVAAQLARPWRIAILSGIGVIAVASALCAWLAMRSVRHQLELARMRGGLVASISHELRTPLTAILVNAELLEDESVEPGARRRYLKRIQDSATRLRTLVQRVLDFARSERKAPPIARTIEDPALLVEAAVAEIEQMLGAHELRVEVPPHAARIQVDKDAFVQVLVGLLENSIKYSGDGAPIRVAGRVREDGYELVVEDRGRGVPDADLVHLFEPFYRSVHSAENVAGTGLGLSIARGIVEAQRGTLRAEVAAPGEPRRGLRMVITLPLPEEHAA